LGVGEEPETTNGEGIKTDNKVAPVALYARVSTKKQQTSLDTQTSTLLNLYPNGIVYSDIGSGVSDTRKGLTRLLLDIMRRDKGIKKVVFCWKDRLSRFAPSIILLIFRHFGVEYEEIYPNEMDNVGDFKSDIADIMAIFTCYCNRASGRKAAIQITRKVDDATLKMMVGWYKGGATCYDIAARLIEMGVRDEKDRPLSYFIVKRLMRGVEVLDPISSFREFIAERLIIDKEGRVLIPDIYREYHRWSKQKGIRAISKWKIGRLWVVKQAIMKTGNREWLKGWGWKQ
jgi:predicted site-specific integrase-resolvase